MKIRLPNPKIKLQNLCNNFDDSNNSRLPNDYLDRLFYVTSKSIHPDFINSLGLQTYPMFLGYKINKKEKTLNGKNICNIN